MISTNVFLLELGVVAIGAVAAVCIIGWYKLARERDKLDGS